MGASLQNLTQNMLYIFQNINNIQNISGNMQHILLVLGILLVLFCIDIITGSGKIKRHAAKKEKTSIKNDQQFEQKPSSIRKRKLDPEKYEVAEESK